MALRSFFAIDNENLIVASSSNPGIVGGPIINNSDTPNGTIFDFGGGTFREVTLDDTDGSGRDRRFFNDDRPGTHTITDGGGLVADGTPVEAESIITVRKLDGSGNPTGPEIDLFVLSQNGQTGNIWGFGSSEPLERGESYIKVDGSNTGTTRYRDFVTCFAAGTRIETPRGDVAVEELVAGQMVWTRDAGPQPLRWVGHAKVSGAGALAPVRIAAGALGNDRDLLVSQQHRIWIESAAAELYFGQASVLVAAKHLCGLPGVDLSPQERVHYTHFMFDRHQIVRANGLLTESFFLAENSVGALEDGPRAELHALFPDLRVGFHSFGATAAQTLNAREAAMLRQHLAA